ncbi:MAG: hypothetical protein GX786_09065, partial [Clostridiales bacterium]|nr:hypothetical protein [Clostridiales bacterium]
MSEFTETIFSFLLGWIKNFFESLWTLFTSNDGSAWLAWLGENWFSLVVWLLIIGFIIDIVIWFFRWRPYYVWFTFGRKLRNIFKRTEKPQPAVSNKTENTSSSNRKEN